MKCSKSSVFQCLDAVLLLAVFIAQSVILIQYTVYHSNGLESNVIIQKILWLSGDLISITVLLLAVWCGIQNVKNMLKSQQGVTIAHKNSLLKYISSGKIPLSYISWLIYSLLLVTKCAIIFKSNEIGNLKGKLFGVHALQLGIGLSAIVFSLLVEAHHDARKVDPRRNAYLNSVSYAVALEMLDTVSFLSMLIPRFGQTGEAQFLEDISSPSCIISPIIIALSSVNLILPSVVLYKLAATQYGQIYHAKLELLYKSLHLLLVNIPFVIIRIYLWNAYNREEVIFGIKNLYSIVGYFRGIYSDVKLLRRGPDTPRNSRTGVNIEANKSSRELTSLM